MKRLGIAFFTGFIFALGLGISGMTQPGKVIGFLDVYNWDPSLLFVMIGAIGLHATLYKIVRNRRTPLLDTQWHIPERKDLTWRLMVGAAIFGVGWGLAGLCPGPALSSVASGNKEPILFVAAMILGMIAFRSVESYLPRDR